MDDTSDAQRPPSAKDSTPLDSTAEATVGPREPVEHLHDVGAGQAPALGGGANVVLHYLLRNAPGRRETPQNDDSCAEPGDNPYSKHLLGDELDLRRRDVAQSGRIPYITARRIWHALGFPDLGSENTPFTEADLASVADISALRRAAGMDDELVLDIVRALSRNTERLATWQTNLVKDWVADHRASTHGDDLGQRLMPSEQDITVERVLGLAQALEPLIVYSWRRHLVHALADMSDDMLGDRSADVLTVGFADLVGFTSAVTGMSERQLSTLVGDFESLASDVITVHGGRMVKTVGDEVLFVCERAAGAAAIGTDLIDALRSDPNMPPLRVGLATGKVVVHSGDVFGTTVNRASRLTGLTGPNSVMVDGGTQAALAVASGFELRAREPLPLKGLGETPAWELSRSSATLRDPEPDSAPDAEPR